MLTIGRRCHPQPICCSALVSLDRLSVGCGTGRVSIARENEAGGSWGQEIDILHVNIKDFVLFLVVLIELFPNSVFQLYCTKDYCKQKQWNTLPVTMITEIMNFNRLLWWLPWH